MGGRGQWVGRAPQHPRLAARRLCPPQLHGTNVTDCPSAHPWEGPWGGVRRIQRKARRSTQSGCERAAGPGPGAEGCPAKLHTWGTGRVGLGTGGWAPAGPPQPEPAAEEGRAPQAPAGPPAADPPAAGPRRAHRSQAQADQSGPHAARVGRGVCRAVPLPALDPRHKENRRRGLFQRSLIKMPSSEESRSHTMSDGRVSVSYKWNCHRFAPQTCMKNKIYNI